MLLAPILDIGCFLAHLRHAYAIAAGAPIAEPRFLLRLLGSAAEA
jgi:hypothetical protein